MELGKDEAMKEHREDVPTRVVRADRWIARNNTATPRQPSYATLSLDDAVETDSRSGIIYIYI